MHKVMTKRGRLSFSAYSQTPADGKRYEYLGGEVYVSPPPSLPHQYTSSRLFEEIFVYFRLAFNGVVFHAPTAVILSDTPPADAEIVEPDLFVVTDRSALSHRALNGAPFVIVEILSPSNASLDRKVKFERYAGNGVPHYWMVDPIAETMECHRLVDGTLCARRGGNRRRVADCPCVDRPDDRTCETLAPIGFHKRSLGLDKEPQDSLSITLAIAMLSSVPASCKAVATLA
jgi:Uma2 family endonuclease